jgi:lipopolysaccharide/colanic/teichoic acid biosynthesis glycosyltransferase
MSRRSKHPARQDPPDRWFPALTGPSAHRISELIALRLAPAVTGAAIAYTRLDSAWQAVLVFICMLLAAIALRRPQYPMHLIPLASAILYLLAPLLGAAGAVAISAADGYATSDVQVADMVPAVLGAWLVTWIGCRVTRSLRRHREVRVAVIGSHEFARGLEAELEAVGVRGHELIGCIDPEQSCPTDSVAGVRCLGSLVLLRQTVLEHGLELLVLGPLSPRAGRSEDLLSAEGGFRGKGVSRLEAFERVADACLDLPVSMIEAGQFYEQLFGHVPLGTTTSAWFQYLLHPSYKQSWPILKRALDLSLGLIAGIIAAPVLALSAIAIKLSDRGPVFYRQKRIGEKGREVELLKLRTMDPYPTADANGKNGSGGHRVTPVGKVLRRLHINELPQIWLVLKGQMSLVGPRPELPEKVTSLEARFAYYDRRHLLKPGITGWASVRCGYSGTPVGEAWKLCHDLYYMKRQSVFFDLLIMLETLSTVFIPEPMNRPDERFIVAARAGEDVRPRLGSAA